MYKTEFKLKQKYADIPSAHRLAWLQKQIRKAMNARATSIERYQEYRQKRYGFETMGPTLANGTQCFVCAEPATLRHHIVPLILGGINKFNNLVPLCHECHRAVHAVGPRVKTPAVRDDDPGVVRIKALLTSMYGSN